MSSAVGRITKVIASLNKVIEKGKGFCKKKKGEKVQPTEERLLHCNTIATMNTKMEKKLERYVGIGTMAKHFEMENDFIGELNEALINRERKNLYVFIDIENMQQALPDYLTREDFHTFVFSSSAKLENRKHILRVAPKNARIHFRQVGTRKDEADVDLIVLCTELHAITTMLKRHKDQWVIMSNDHIFECLTETLNRSGTNMTLPKFDQCKKMSSKAKVQNVEAKTNVGAAVMVPDSNENVTAPGCKKEARMCRSNECPSLSPNIKAVKKKKKEKTTV